MHTFTFNRALKNGCIIGGIEVRIRSDCAIIWRLLLHSRNLQITMSYKHWLLQTTRSSKLPTIFIFKMIFFIHVSVITRQSDRRMTGSRAARVDRAKHSCQLLTKTNTYHFRKQNAFHYKYVILELHHSYQRWRHITGIMTVPTGDLILTGVPSSLGSLRWMA